MTPAQYSRLKSGDKVKLLSPITNNSNTVTLPTECVLIIGYMVPRVRRSLGMPWFFWSCQTPGGNEGDRTGITNPNTIEKLK